MSEQKIFNEIYSLIKSKKYEIALNKLKNKGNGHLRLPYKNYPNNAWYCLGDLEFKRSNFKSAIKYFRKSFFYDSADVDCLMAISNCYEGLSKPHLSEKYLKMALLIPMSVEKKNAIEFNLGNSFYDQGKYHEAIFYYEKINAIKYIKKAAKNIKLSREFICFS